MMRVSVAYALPDEQFEASVDLPAGACVADALAAVASDTGFVEVDLAQAPVGIYGETVARGRLLEDGDRVEIYRELLIDPKEARRLRARHRR